MTTKQQVIKLASDLNCKLDINSTDIALHAPKGKLLGGELHISVYELGLYKKGEIWNNLHYELMTMMTCSGSDFCNCNN